jgi:hypothetical protein
MRKYFLSLITFIFILSSCSKTGKLEKLISDIPPDVKPSTLKEYPTILDEAKIEKKDNATELSIIKTCASNDSILQYDLDFKNKDLHVSKISTEIIKLLPSDKQNSIVLLTYNEINNSNTESDTSIISHSYKIRVLKKENNQWTNISDSYFPAEIHQIDNKSNSVGLEILNNEIILKDFANNLSVRCSLQNKSFVVIGSIPKYFGDVIPKIDNSPVETETDSVFPILDVTDEEMTAFWTDFKRAVVAKNKEKVIAMTHFPFTHANLGNVGSGVYEANQEEFEKYLFSIFFYFQDFSLLENDLILSNNNDFSKEIVQVPNDLKIYEYSYSDGDQVSLYFMKYPEGIKVFAYKNYSYGD